MKQLTRRAFTAAGILAALGAGVSFIPSCNHPTSVYGPPPEYDPKNNEIEDVYGPPEDFEVTENVPEPLYGPPEDVGMEAEPQASEDVEASEGYYYDPSENELVDVYGPPEDYEPGENILTGVYGPPEDDPSQTIVAG